MEVRRRSPLNHKSSKCISAGEPLKPHPSEPLPLPLYLTNGLFFTMFFSVIYFLLHRWREKIRIGTPLHVITLSELIPIVSLLASGVYLLGFFGIDFVQSIFSRPNHEPWDVDLDHDKFLIQQDIVCSVPKPALKKDAVLVPFGDDDEEVISGVVSGKIASYSLESKLGDCKRAAAIRREALQRITGRSMEGLPLEGFDYDSILGQCCEMPVGYVQLPVGIAGPLLLDGVEYSVPMATTEGCLVASTNRGCKAIHLSGGASSELLRDGMTRAPVVRFQSAKRAAKLKFFMEDQTNFETICLVFNK